MVSLVISVAVQRDLRDLHQFLFEKPHQNLRRRTLFDVKRMIENRSFLIARRSGQIVGTCYITEDPEEEAFEFGGAYVHSEYRGLGLFRLMGRVAITNLFIMNRPEQRLIAHVLQSNAGPRNGLADLGFVVAHSDVAFKPEMIPGLEHMKPNDDGYVLADVLEFKQENYIRLLEEEVAFDGRLPDLRGAKCVAVIRVPAWQIDKQILRDALVQLRRSQLGSAQEGQN